MGFRMELRHQLVFQTVEIQKLAVLLCNPFPFRDRIHKVIEGPVENRGLEFIHPVVS